MSADKNEIVVAGHAEELLNQLETLRAQGTLCDVSLCAQDGELYAHRLVLMTSSPVLAARLRDCSRVSIAQVHETNGENRMASMHQLKFDQVSLQVLLAVVRFLYTGKLSLSATLAKMVKEFCASLDLKAAVEACENYLSSETELEPANSGPLPEAAVNEKEKDKNLKESPESKGGVKLRVKLKRIKAAPQEEEVVKPKRKCIPRKTKVTETPVTSPKKPRTRKPANPRRKAGTSLPRVLGLKAIKQETQNVSKNSNDKLPEKITSSEAPEVDNDDSGFDNTVTDETDKAVVIKREDVDDDDEENQTDDDYDEGTDDFDSDYEVKKKSKKTNTPIPKKSKVKSAKSKKATGAKRGRKPREKVEGDGEKRPLKKRRRKRFPCTQCSKVLSSYKRLVFHEFSKHGTPYDETKYQMVPCNEEGCTYVAADRHNLDVHMKSRHGEARPHICEFCGKAFKLPNILATHLNIHTGQKVWKCEQCGESFNQQSGLDVHVKRHHMGESTWAELCHLCSEKFLLKSELSWHLFRVHDQPLPDNFKVYVCDICGFTTMKKAGLQSHKERHAGIKKHICPICQKACSTKSELRRHVGFHGEKKFKCTFDPCKFACTDAIGLDKHIKLMHTHKDYKPYACPVCPYRTGVRGNVDKHIRTVHDLIVVTKHTVQLKMKYPNFSSGDVITKEGQLIATAADRKALQQAPQVDKDGNMVSVVADGNSADFSNIKNSKNTYQKYKQSRKYNKQQSEDQDLLATVTSSTSVDNSIFIPPIGDIPSTVVNLAQASIANNLPGHNNAKDLTALANYVYIHGDNVMSTLGVSSMDGAQDLRLQVPVSITNGSQSEQHNVFTLSNQDFLLPNKFEFQQ